MHEIPTLYKYCKWQHNLAWEGESARIGSLRYYRSFEHAEIGDNQEGIKKHMGFINEQVEKIPIYHMTPNCLIFSATTELQDGLADYDSCYKIVDPVAFSRILAQAILDTLVLDDIRGLNFDPERVTIRDLSSISVQMERRIVSYVDRSQIGEVRYDFNNVEINNPLFEMDSIPFWKDISYESQKEFRFTFRLCRQDVPGSQDFIDIRHDYLDVDLYKYKNKLPVEFVY